MRVAITTGVLKIPPTYFVVNHAEQLSKQHTFEVFTLAADIEPNALSVPVNDFVPGRGLPFAQRMVLGPLFAPLMTRSIRRFHPDIIHQHFATWSGPAVHAAGARVPLVTTVHGYDVLLAGRRPRTLVERWQQTHIENARKRSRLVLAVSEFLAGRAVAAGFDPSRLQVHYQGVDTSYFTPSSNFTPSSGAGPWGEVPTVTFVGALATRKGIQDLVTASCDLIGSIEHRLVVIGAGPLEADLRKQTTNHPHIDYLGALNRADVREQLRHSTVVVLPTQEHNGWREAAGLVLVEAQACGTPVIAYDSGGTAEMLRDGVSGLLVAEKDIGALRSAIRDVLTLGSGEYGQMRHAARAFANDERSLRRSCTELLLHYDEVTVQ